MFSIVNNLRVVTGIHMIDTAEELSIVSVHAHACVIMDPFLQCCILMFGRFWIISSSLLETLQFNTMDREKFKDRNFEERKSHLLSD